MKPTVQKKSKKMRSTQTQTEKDDVMQKEPSDQGGYTNELITIVMMMMMMMMIMPK